MATNVMLDDDPFSFDVQKPASATPALPGSTPATTNVMAPPSYASAAFGGQTPTATAGPSFSFDEQPAGAPGAEMTPSGPAAMPPPGGSAPNDVGSTSPAGPRATPAAASSAQKYTDLLRQIASATDPAQKAVLQDQLGRDLFSGLTAAGHDVKWQGEQLIVDGRAYVLGDGSGIASGEPNPNAPQGPFTVANPPMTANSTAPSGYDQAKWDKVGAGTSDSAKYIVSESISRILDQVRAIPDAAGRKAFVQQHLQTLVPQLEQQGWTVHEIRGEKMLIEGHGAPPHWADALGRIEQGGAAMTPAWTTDLEQQGGTPITPLGGAEGPPLIDTTPQSYDPVASPSGPAAPGALGWTPGQGPTYTPGTIGDEDIPRLSYEDLLAQMEMGPVANVPTDYATGQISNAPADFGRVEEDYAAGTVSNDPLDTYSFEGFGDLGELGAGKTDAQTEALISDILANPESYPPQVVAMLKAQSKDELADMQLQEDEDLTALGYRTGNADSNWLASERLGAKGRRDQSLVASNRAIDLEAAATNNADRRSAASLGQSYGDSTNSRNLANRGQRFSEATASEGFEQDEITSKNRASAFKREGEVTNESMRGSAFDRRTGSQRSNIATRQAEAAFGREGELANEGLRGEAFDRRQKAQQQNIDNAFRSAAEKRAAVGLASDQSLKAAALRGDRMALRETLAQKAAELGISKDQVMSSWVLGLMDDATRNRSVDIGASIDRAKLDQQSEQFKMDLAFKFAQLAQQNDMFGASWGLDFSKYALDADALEYKKYQDSLSYED